MAWKCEKWNRKYIYIFWHCFFVHSPRARQNILLLKASWGERSIFKKWFIVLKDASFVRKRQKKCSIFYIYIYLISEIKELTHRGPILLQLNNHDQTSLMKNIEIPFVYKDKCTFCSNNVLEKTFNSKSDLDVFIFSIG